VTLASRLTAEAGGTAALVIAIIGSGIMATNLTDDVALALLCNALATAAALVVIIALLQPISGAHLNPAVSAVLAARGELGWGEAACYSLAQVAGAVAGVIVAHAMFELPLLQLGTTPRAGAGQWLAEVVATGGLIGVVLLGERSRQVPLPLLVGLYILAAYWFTASTSFATPPSRSARALTTTFAGIAPLHAVWFIVAQAAGATAAALLATTFAVRESAKRSS